MNQGLKFHKIDILLILCTYLSALQSILVTVVLESVSVLVLLLT